MAASLTTFRHLPLKYLNLCGISNGGLLSRLSPAVVLEHGQHRHNSSTASVTRPKRTCYTRTYPTMLVFPDGSTIHIRYKEPRKIIKLPMDFSQLSEAEKRVVLAKRKPKQELVEEDIYDDSFDASEYTQYWKK